jgi:hypothetical protein
MRNTYAKDANEVGGVIDGAAEGELDAASDQGVGTCYSPYTAHFEQDGALRARMRCRNVR